MVARQWIENGCRPGLALRALEINRSTYYYTSRTASDTAEARGGRRIPGFSYRNDGTMVSDEQVKEWICEMIAGDGFAYGYLKLTWCLRRTHALVINKKKVYRLCKQMSLLRPQRKLKRHHPRRLNRNREITAPNQLWETDLKYGYVPGERRFFFVVNLLDVYDRCLIHSHIGLTARAEDVTTMLWQALWKRQLLESETKPVIRSDNGPQFISDAFEGWCVEHGIEHERIPCKTPNKNAHIEAFHRILEDECLSLHEFETFGQAYAEVAEFMRYYNERRIHSAIHYMTPDEFHRAYQSNGARVLPIRV
jgi:putative transposase